MIRSGLIGVVCDTWKVAIFRKTLQAAGFGDRIEHDGPLTEETHLFRVKAMVGTPTADRLQAAVRKAELAAKRARNRQN